MHPVICVEMLYPGSDIQYKIQAVAGMGFRYIEFWGWRDKNLETIKAACTRHNVTVANFSAHRRGSPVAAVTHAAVLSDFGDALAAAASLGCSCLMFLSNELGENGEVVESYPHIPDAVKLQNFAQLLREADRMAPPDMTLVIEPLNTRVDHPGNYLKDMATAVEIVDAAASSRVKILCDLYHLGVMGDDLEWVIRTYHDHIGYVHIADVPGRHEPGTGSVDWPRLIRALGDSGYDGPVGFEYDPVASSAASLSCIGDMWREVMHDE